MSIFFPNTAGTVNVLGTSTYTGAATQILTTMCWFMIPTVGTPAAYRDILLVEPNLYMQVFSDGSTMDYGTQNSDHTAQVLTAGVWYHTCQVVVPTSTTARQIYGYLDGQLAVNVTDTTTFTTYTHFSVGNSTVTTEANPLSGYVQDVRIWTRQLSNNEIIAEMNSKVPIHKQALLLWSPFDVNSVVDKSGKGNIWTMGSAVTLQAGPINTYVKSNTLK